MKKRLLLILTALLILLSACAEKVKPEYVLYVNGTGVTREELVSYAWRFIGQVDTDNTITAESFNTVFDSSGTSLNLILLDGALECLLLNRFFAEKASEMDIKLTNSEQKELDAMISSLYATHGGKAEYEAYLKASGMSAATNRVIYSEDVLQTKVIKALFGAGGKQVPTISDLEDFFRWNYVTVSHVLRLCVDLNSGSQLSEAEQAVALRESELVIFRANEGVDFFELVDEHGQDSKLFGVNPPTYTFTRGTMSEVFEQAAFSLAIDEITQEPVRTAYGYHVIKRLELDGEYFLANQAAISEAYTQAECDAMYSIWKESAVLVYTPAYSKINMQDYFKQ